MNKRRIERMYIKAMDLLFEPDAETEKLLVKEDDAWKVPSNFNGYMASFAIDVNQAGLLNTIATYSQRNNQGTVTERVHICNFIKKTLIGAGFLDINENDSLEQYVRKGIENGGSNKRIYLKKMILEASVACKKALRTMPVKLVNNDNNN